jgi:hypothetical protein
MLVADDDQVGRPLVCDFEKDVHRVALYQARLNPRGAARVCPLLRGSQRAVGRIPAYHFLETRVAYLRRRDRVLPP